MSKSQTRCAGAWGWKSLVAVCTFSLLAGCDQLGIETPESLAQRKLSEAKAVGAACRHAERAIEDCYLLNPKSEKASVFEGWREMDEYMRENKIEGVKPSIPRAVPAPRPRSSGANLGSAGPIESTQLPANEVNTK